MASKWNTALGVVTKIAPMIATAAVGPLGGSAVTALTSALGLATSTNKDKQQDAIADAIQNATPEQLMAIKTAELEFRSKMAELGFQNEKDIADVNMQDRDSARKREIAVRDLTPQIIAYAVTAGFFSLLGWVAVHEVPAGTKDILNIMIGALGASWTGIVAYYFGSSAGSAEKTGLLAKAQPVKE